MLVKPDYFGLCSDVCATSVASGVGVKRYFLHRWKPVWQNKQKVLLKKRLHLQKLAIKSLEPLLPFARKRVNIEVFTINFAVRRYDLAY